LFPVGNEANINGTGIFRQRFLADNDSFVDFFIVTLFFSAL